MTSISKHQKMEDRISNLPSSLISHILSFLPTKEAVRTSGLSTYWKQQWTSITSLNFECPDDENGEYYDYDYPRSKDKFVNCVFRVLLFLKATRLYSFKLKLTDYFDDLYINAWVSAALSLEVQQLHIYVPKLLKPFTPDSLFTSRTLVVLKLGRNINLHVPTTISLASLKMLHLKSVEFSDDDSLSRLIRSCPTLEDLEIQGLIGRNLKVISISSLGLKRLTLMNITWAVRVHEIYAYAFVLNTPNLQHLKHVDIHMPESYSLVGWLPYLVRADICFEQNSQQHLAWEANTMSLFAGISNVRFLCLSSKTIEGQNKMMCRFLNYLHLTYLKISAGMLLTNFLDNTPNLQTLVYEGDFVNSDLDTEIVNNWCRPASVQSCISSQLRIIEVPSFEGKDKGLQLLSYFLDKSEVLQELRIGYTGYAKNNQTIISNKLLALPRASRSCKIIVM